jgi:DNA (cytosine-5)-methyltransferase 1
MNSFHFFIELRERKSVVMTTDKPPYRIPLMDEIRAIPWNGFKVASTFSGAGGSCTGYRMAGFKIVWANEFVPIAQESYKINAAEDCILDSRDIRQIQPKEILEVTGLKKGEIDLFDGSPPCQAFSTAGKREKGWGKGKRYEHGAVQCNEQLFDEYIRLLRGLMPKTFVAENVSGLVKGKAKGFFLEILKELKASGYRVICRVLDAQWLGVPQTRQRTIFVGVREDLGVEPVHPKPLSYRYSVRDALPWIGKAIHDTSGIMSGGEVTDSPSPAVMANRSGTHFIEVQSGAYPKKFSSADQPSPAGDDGRTTEIRSLPPSRLKEGAYGIPDVKPDEPCRTVTTASPGNNLAVPYGITRRKFTIDELKRICAFPDDFILKGSYSQQWERLGNSVPPVMMKYIAETVRDEILLKVTA